MTFLIRPTTVFVGGWLRLVVLCCTTDEHQGDEDPAPTLARLLARRTDAVGGLNPVSTGMKP